MKAHSTPLRLLPVALLVTGCGKPPPPDQGGPGDFPVLAVVAPAVVEPLDDSVFLVGSLESPDRTELVAELSGTLTELNFDEGATVAKGETLVRIDTTKVEARIAGVEARLRLAQDEHKRITRLVESGAATPQEKDTAISEE